MKGYYLNDQKTGKWEFYDSHGILKRTGFYHENKKIGKWEFFRNKYPVVICEYHNNLKNGSYERYDQKHDKLVQKGVYRSGLRYGEWIIIPPGSESYKCHYWEGKIHGSFTCKGVSYYLIAGLKVEPRAYEEVYWEVKLILMKYLKVQEITNIILQYTK